VEFWPDRFFVRYLKKGWLILVEGFLDPNYKLCDMTRPNYNLTVLFPHIDE
jgi:hypothetical protein